MESRYFLTRHSFKPKGEDAESKRYKGISKKGVELARSSAKNILDDIERSPKGAVIFLGGASNEVRTRSTAEVYGDELKRLLAGRKDYIVITRDDLPRGKGYNAIAKQVKEVITANPDKKVIVDIPFFLKEFSPPKEQEGRAGWFTREGKPTAYLANLVEKHKGDEYEMMKDWLTTRGREGELKGPIPEDIAKSYEKGLSRLEKFTKKYVEDRPYVIGIVGHSCNADAYLTYIAGGGKVDLPTFEKISSGKEVIKETEMASIMISPEITTLTYRGKEHKRKSLEKLTGAVAIISIFSGLFLLSSNITGNTIANINQNFNSLLSSILLLIGLVTGFFWIKLRS